MQILIKRASPEEVAEFFHRNRWLIERLLANNSAVSDHADDNDSAAVDESPVPDHSDEDVATTAEDVAITAEELEEQIMDSLEEIEEVIDDLESEDLENEEAQEILEDIEETLEEIVDILDCDNDDKEEDDLTQIKGLGGKTLEKLNEAGITTFQQVIDLTDEQIEELDSHIRNFAINYERKNFRQQAKDLQ